MTHYDVVIIGGGINGVGVAQAAAAHGYSVLLLEQTQLAAGTSSRSSKLIHGGLRYLESFELNLVYEALKERRALLTLAPELVRLTPFHIPIYAGAARGAGYVRAGLMLYALLARGGGSGFATLPRRDWDTLDGLDTNGLQTVFRYYDAQTDDAALTRAVMRSAIALGAELACPACFLEAAATGDGYHVAYATEGAEQDCDATVLVNAAGPWIEDVARAIQPGLRAPAIERVQGTHVLLPGRTQQGCYYLEAADHRAVFVLPWRDCTLIGTTEVPFSGDPARATPSTAEIEYLRATFTRYFPARDTRVLEAYAGVRVLPCGDGSLTARSREVMLAVDDACHPHLVAIYGGKLTAFRRTAANVVRRLAHTLGSRPSKADPAQLRLTPD